MYNQFIKRLIDILFSLAILIAVVPILIIISIILAWNNRGLVFFKQPRPGKNEKIFVLFKFKTMNDRKDKNGNLLPDSERLTTLGRYIRKSSLDELPQFVNVLKGDMSIIGPRPLLISYLNRYTIEQARRHEVKPGITGWAQINGRNAISWEEKFKLDVWYVQNISFWVDMQILFMTIGKIVKRSGINQEGSATAEEFKGG